VQHAPLRVVAMMDFGSVDLAHLSDLSVGEILVGDRKLDEALQIHLEGQGSIATGYLRRLGEQRAVMLDGVKQQEKSSHE
jgi:flagellar motor switch protein FliM